MPPRRLNPAIPRELETIVLKAIDKEAAGRYDTAQEMADDLRRFIDEKPIRAKRPSMLEHATKWARRHTAAVWTAAVVLLAGMVGLAVSNRMIARRSAVIALQRDEVKSALKQSEEAREQAEETSRFLVEVFRSPDPERDGSEIKMVDVLIPAAANLDAAFPNSPRIRGELFLALGQTFYGLGLPAPAAELFEKANKVLLAELGPDHPQTLECRNNLALAYVGVGRAADAIELDEATLKMRVAKLGIHHAATLETRLNLATDYLVVGNTRDAISLMESTIELMEANLGPENRQTIGARNNLAMALLKIGRTKEAIAMMVTVLKLRRATLSPDHPATLASEINLGSAYQTDGRVADAIPLHEEALRGASRNSASNIRSRFVPEAISLRLTGEPVGSIVPSRSSS